MKNQSLKKQIPSFINLWNNKYLRNFFDCLISSECLFPAMLAWTLSIIMNYLILYWLQENGVVWNILNTIWADHAWGFSQLIYHNYFIQDISTLYNFWLWIIIFCFIISQLLLLKKRKFSLCSCLIYLVFYAYLYISLHGYTIHFNMINL